MASPDKEKKNYAQWTKLVSANDIPPNYKTPKYDDLNERKKVYHVQ